LLTPTPRVRLAVALGKGAATASRYLSGGAGDVIGGTVAQRLHPDLLAELGRGRVLACVSGTNGKTTTTRMLTVALGPDVAPISNGNGANMTAGLISALMSAPPHRPAVLEVDEMYLGRTIAAVAPQVVLLLNLSRDQIDRTAETRRLAQGWREALAVAPTTIVVANCDDPLVVWAAETAADPVWVSVGQAWTGDAQSCPVCGGALTRHASQLPTEPPDEPGDGAAVMGVPWSCNRCGFARPDPAAALHGDDLVTAAGQRLPISVSLPGRANRGNAVMATVAATQLGQTAEQALARIGAIAEVQGRYGVHQVSGVSCRLLLAKNPASWLETLDMLDERKDRPLVICVGARAVDGRDTSWLYDVTYERLAGRQVTASGRYAADLSLRLWYADVAHTLIEDMEAAIRTASQPSAAATRSRSGSPSAEVDVVGDYSSFQELRRLAPRRGRGVQLPSTAASEPARPSGLKP
jgi:UDP-N-acetylmuramyl tripeptide synthase